ncbi:hypothetical protein ABZ777_15620 [Micromonospora parva]|uniref:hypothetical protein n=1 Tax=Micromonospora parva TaxID=1464048 RepID=UPI00340AB577
MTLHDMDLGDLPTWISAGVALAALIAVIRAASAAWRTLSLERARDEERQRSVDRAQADLVAAWPALANSDPFDPDSPVVWGVVVRNASALPIHQVSVDHLDSGVQSVRYEAIPPGDFLLVDREMYPRPEGVVPPRLPDNLPTREWTVELRFSDMAERRWHRDRRGNLVRIAPDPSES